MNNISFFNKKCYRTQVEFTLADEVTKFLLRFAMSFFQKTMPEIGHFLPFRSMKSNVLLSESLFSNPNPEFTLSNWNFGWQVTIRIFSGYKVNFWQVMVPDSASFQGEFTALWDSSLFCGKLSVPIGLGFGLVWRRVYLTLRFSQVLR